MSSPAESNDPVLNTCPECDQHIDVTELEPFAKVECPHCSATMRVRTTFDHFQLVEQIGQGGMSRVFRAADLLLGRDVALKILNQECASATERIAQFEREAQITASFSHPNVVKVFSVGEDHGFFYIAMELVSYSSFEDVISRRGRISEAEVLNIGVAVSQGLLAAQCAGLIHRDIKPGNVLFAEDGTAKIVDFGLALVVERDVDTSNEIWATPYYVAPEKLRGGNEDFRSDMYSLGATLFHALAGVPPVETNTTSIEELRKLKEQPVDLGRVAADVTQPSVNVINRMLACEPSQRFDSYDQLVDALQAAKQGKVIAVGDGRKGLLGSKKKMLLLAGIAAALMALGAVFFQGDSTSPGGAATNLILDETSSGAESSTGKFLEARSLLLAGNYSESATLFSAVAESETTQQPTTNWALFNLGLCQLLRFDEDSAIAAFQRILGNGVFSKNREDLDLVTFFLDVAKHAQSPDPVRQDQMKAFKGAGYECVGLLPVGLRRWGLGDVEGAAVLLQDFQQRARSSDLQWVSAYSKLARPILADAKLLSEIPELPDEGIDDEIGQLKAFLTVSKKVENKLKVHDGAPRSRLAALITAAEQRMAESNRADAEESAKLALQRIRKDRKDLRAKLRELVPLREQQQLEECAKRLEQFQPVSDQVGRERDAWVQILRDADGFVTSLGQLRIARGIRGPVIPRTGKPLFGKSYRLTPGGIDVQRDDQPKVKHVPFGQCSPTFLISLGESALLSVSDSDRYLELVTRLASFARTYELEGGIDAQLKKLADAVDVETYGRERLQILVAGRATTPQY